MAASQMTSAQVAQAAAQQNAAARAAVLANSIEALQSIYSNSGLNPTVQSVVNVAPRNVGLIRGFYIHVGFQATNATGGILTRSVMGPANLLSLVTFNDLSNQQRINTQGWYLPYLDSQRRRNQSFSSELATGVPGSQASGVDSPLGLQANVLSTFSGAATPVQSCPATVAAGATFNVDFTFYVPLSYTDRDLRGAIYAAVVNSVMNLQITFNNSGLVAASTVDPTLSCFVSSNATTTLTNPLWSVEVYQDFLDQIPFTNNGPILPFQDLSWSYLLNTTFFTSMSAGQDYPIPFPNFRNIQSMTLFYDNSGTLNHGTDINYLALQSANYTNIFKVSPAIQALLTRALMHSDMPAGGYYFDFRRKPLSTVQYGNLNLVVNPSNVSTALGAAQFLVGFESLAQQNQVVGAGSIAGG